MRITAAYEFSTRSAVAQDTDPRSTVMMTGTFAPVRVVPQVRAAPVVLAAPDVPQPASTPSPRPTATAASPARNGVRSARRWTDSLCAEGRSAGG